MAKLGANMNDKRVTQYVVGPNGAMEAPPPTNIEPMGIGTDSCLEDKKNTD